MNKQIAINAWELVSEFHSLKKLNFLSSFFGMSWLLLVLFYQITFTVVGIFGGKDAILNYLYHLPSESYFLPLSISVVFIFLFYVLLAPVARGGMIHMMHIYRKNNGKKFHRSWQGFFDGLSHFLPMFEIQNMIAIFAPITIITTTIFLMRLFGSEIWWIIWGIMGIYFLFSLVLNLCFVYAPFFVVIEKKRGMQALSASTAMAMNHINITSKIFFTNILLYLRTLFVGTIFLFLPFIATSIIAYFNIIELKIIFLLIFSLISVLLFIFIVHLNSSLEIFILAIWYEAYRECAQEQKL